MLDYDELDDEHEHFSEEEFKAQAILEWKCSYGHVWSGTCDEGQLGRMNDGPHCPDCFSEITIKEN